jgi:hypothetical protein
MNPYVETRLEEWAAWSVMRMDGFYGIGGSQFSYDEPLPGHERGYFTVPANARCMETEEAVAWLRMERCRAADCIRLHYRDHPGWSALVKAEFMGFNTPRTFWREVNRGHGLLLTYFIDRALGIFPQLEEIRENKRLERLFA